ncbi:hypothetical protein Bca4012_033762 [Brassica carinata]
MDNRRYDERSDYAGGLKAGRRLSSGTSSSNKFNLSGRQGGCVCVCVQGDEDDVNVI